MESFKIVGKWSVPGHSGEFFGELSFTPSEGGRLLLEDCNLPLSKRIDIIHGTTFKRKKLTLYSCYVNNNPLAIVFDNSNSGVQFEILIDYIFIGSHFNEVGVSSRLGQYRTLGLLSSFSKA